MADERRGFQVEIEPPSEDRRYPQPYEAIEVTGPNGEEYRFGIAISNQAIYRFLEEGFETVTMYDLITAWIEARESWTVERLSELAFQAGGAATAPLLEDHPDYIFPSERCKVAVENVLREFGVEE